MDPYLRTSTSSSAQRPLAAMAVEPLLSRDFDTRPSLVYERLRQRYGPVAPVDVLGVPMWIALGYAEVQEVLRNTHGTWSKRPGDWRALAEGRVPKDWPLLPALEIKGMVTMEGPRHTAIRGAWSEALQPFEDRTQPQARQLEAAIVRYADDLITVLSEGSGRGGGWADLAAQYARPLPLMIINRLLGLDSAQGDDLLMDLWRLLDGGPDAAVAHERYYSAIAVLAATKMAQRGEDFPSYLLAARPDFTVDELTSEMGALTGIIGDFNANLIGTTITELIIGGTGGRGAGGPARPSAQQVREAINRVMLANPPLANPHFRYATAQVRLGDFTIAAGDPVIASVAAAHTDPRFGAGGAGTHAHLAWGAGPHGCLARELATTITTLAVTRLFERLGTVELALPPDQLPWRPSPFVRGLRSLPVRYELAAPAQEQTAARAVRSEQSGSALWRFLRSLRRER